MSLLPYLPIKNLLNLDTGMLSYLPRKSQPELTPKYKLLLAKNKNWPKTNLIRQSTFELEKHLHDDIIITDENDINHLDNKIVDSDNLLTTRMRMTMMFKNSGKNKAINETNARIAVMAWRWYLWCW